MFFLGMRLDIMRDTREALLKIWTGYRIPFFLIRNPDSFMCLVIWDEGIGIHIIHVSGVSLQEGLAI